APTVTVADTEGVEQSPIALSITSALSDSDGETLKTVISGIPAGATLSDGTPCHTIVVTGGSQDVSTWNLANLKITPTNDTTFTLTVTATATYSDNPAQPHTSANFPDTTVYRLAPTVTVADTEGVEQSPIALSITSALSDSDGETLKTV